MTISFTGTGADKHTQLLKGVKCNKSTTSQYHVSIKFNAKNKKENGKQCDTGEIPQFDFTIYRNGKIGLWSLVLNATINTISVSVIELM